MADLSLHVHLLSTRSNHAFSGALGTCEKAEGDAWHRNVNSLAVAHTLAETGVYVVIGCSDQLRNSALSMKGQLGVG